MDEDEVIEDEDEVVEPGINNFVPSGAVGIMMFLYFYKRIWFQYDVGEHTILKQVDCQDVIIIAEDKLRYDLLVEVSEFVPITHAGYVRLDVSRVPYHNIDKAGRMYIFNGKLVHTTYHINDEEDRNQLKMEFDDGIDE